MLDPVLLRSFVTIADNASFTRAAELLNSTQSTISQHLGRLEQRLGHVLIDRSARPVGLTAAGERLVGYARRLLALQDEAQLLLADPAGTATIRIGVPDDIVTAAMSQQFARFAERHREMRLDVTTGLSRELARQFRGGEFDIAIVKEAGPDSDALASFPEPLAWFEAAAREKAWPDPIPLVTFPSRGLYRDVMIERIERERRRWYLAFTGNSLSSVLSAIEAGLGLSVLPVATTTGYAVRQSQAFGAESPLVLSIYAWEGEGPIGELVSAMSAILRTR